MTTFIINGQTVEADELTISVQSEAPPAEPPIDPDPPIDPEPPIEPPINPPADTVLKYAISAEEWDSTSTVYDMVTIPKGKVVASRFVTNASSERSGAFKFSTPSSMATPSTDFWVSLEPGGAPISDKALQEGKSFVYSMNWTQFDYRYCSLEPNTRYYLNIKHSNPDTEDSVVERFISNNGR